MAFEAARLQVVVEEQGIDKTSRSLNEMGGQVEKAGSRFGDLSGAVKGFALGVGFQQAGQIMFDMAKAAAEDAASVEKLNQAVINAEGSLDGHAAALERAVSRGQELAFTDDQVRDALALMTATIGDADEALRRLETAQNLARGTGMDLVTAAKLLGRVNDENINVLSRYGIQVEKTATAQDLLNAVDAKFAGQAGAYAETDAAKLERMSIAVGELQESLGSLLLPAVVALATEVTEAADAVMILNNAFGNLIGNSDGAGGSISLLGSAFRAANPLMFGALDGIELLGGAFDDTKESGDPIITMFRDIAKELRQTEQDARSAALGIAEVDAALDQLNGRVAEAGGESGLGKVGKSTAELSDAARIAKGELTEFASAGEMVTDAMQDAAVQVNILNSAAASGIQGFNNLNASFDSASSVISGYESSIANAETALEILKGEQEENGSLTAEQQRQYDLLTTGIERYKGGIEDSEGAVVDAAVAHVEYTQKLDDLNGKLASGEITSAEYARSMADITAETDPAASSAYNLAGAQGDLQLAIEGVVNKLGNLLIDLGLLPESKRTEFTTPGMPEAQQGVDELKGKINEVPSSFTITANLDASAFYAGVAQMEGFIPHSPAKEGPLAFTPDWSWITAGAADDMEPGIREAMDRIKSYLTGIDLDSILDDQADMLGEIANLEALRDALAQLGDTSGVDALNEQIAALQAEYATLVAIIGTDAVQAWIDNQNAAQQAAEAAEEALRQQEEAVERLREAQDRLNASTVAAIEGIAAGGDAAGSFIERMLADVDAAREAFNLAQLLGVSPEQLAILGEELSAAEELLSQGTRSLQTALLSGLVDEATLQALAEAGGEWFRALYDQLFGPDALAELEEGWNAVAQIPVDQLAAVIPLLEDGGAEVIDTLVEAVEQGAISYEDALGLLGDATGEQVNEIIAELEALETALTVQLAEAILAGNLELADSLEEQLAIIEQFLTSLEDRAVEAAATVVQAGKSMAAGFSAAVSEMNAAAESAFDPNSYGGSGSGGSRGGGGGQSLFESDDPRVKTYLGLDPTPSWGEYWDWNAAQRDAGLLSPTGQTTSGFYNTYHPGALSPTMGGTTPPMNEQQMRSAVRDGVREGAREGIAAGMTGFQIPPGR